MKLFSIKNFNVLAIAGILFNYFSLLGASIFFPSMSYNTFMKFNLYHLVFSVFAIVMMFINAIVVVKKSSGKTIARLIICFILLSCSFKLAFDPGITAADESWKMAHYFSVVMGNESILNLSIVGLFWWYNYSSKMESQKKIELFMLSHE